MSWATPNDAVKRMCVVARALFRLLRNRAPLLHRVGQTDVPAAITALGFVLR